MWMIIRAWCDFAYNGILYIHRESVKEQLKEVNIICNRVKLTCIVLEYVNDKRRRTKLERRSFIGFPKYK